MIRQIIKIDHSLCNGCGLCISACHEGAIGLIQGKATLLRDDYCDGLGNCLPICPTGALSFEEREALPYDEEQVQKNMCPGSQAKAIFQDPLPCGCSGSHVKSIQREKLTHFDQLEGQGGMMPPCGFGQRPKGLVSVGRVFESYGNRPAKLSPAAGGVTSKYDNANMSQLGQWPVQIKLVPVNAPYFDNAHVLIAADCSAYAYGNFHNDYMRNKITLIGCPKLDEGDYSEKIGMIIKSNTIKSVTVVRMEVPCCGGMENAVKHALQSSGKMIPWQVVTLRSDGSVVEN